MKHEYFELHNILKDRIKGKIYIGIKDGDTTVNIVGFKGIRYKINIDEINDRVNLEDIANRIEYKYRSFILNKFLHRRYK